MVVVVVEVASEVAEAAVAEAVEAKVRVLPAASSVTSPEIVRWGLMLRSNKLFPSAGQRCQGGTDKCHRCLGRNRPDQNAQVQQQLPPAAGKGAGK